MGVLAFVFAGCRKEEPKPEIPSSSPASYMKDPVFRKGLADRTEAQRKIAAERAVCIAKMEALAKAHGGDEVKLKQLPEWNELQAKAKALGTQYEAARQDLLKYTRERISPKKISK